MNRLVGVGALFLSVATSGCIGGIRETTTARTSTEELLISTAAERAIAGFDRVDTDLKGKRVAIDDTRFESVDKGYAVSALRHYVSERGALLVPLVAAKIKNAEGKDVDGPGPERILEIRNGALGLNDTSFGFGIPAIPLAVPSMPITSMSPPLYFFFRGKQEGWAKFQFWIFDPATQTYVAKSKDLWGHTYYSKWWFLFAGPFDFSNDVYPDDSEVNK